jgi:DNA-binding phage protein
MNATYAPFDPADYLDSDDVITAYLLAARADPDPNIFLAALYDVVKAREIAKRKTLKIAKNVHSTKKN